MTSHFDPKPFLSHACLVESTDQLKRFLDEVAHEDLFAVDTESAGFYRYRGVVNLIQVCTRTRAAIFDPQSIQDFSPFQAFAEANPEREWVFHGADYDAQAICRDFHVEVPRIFDTRIAAEFLGLKELGLSPLAEKYLGFALDKKLQRTDWSRRPLTQAMKDYALLDAICLVPIRDILRNMLQAKGRLSWALEEFEDIKRLPKTDPKVPNPFGYMVKGSNILPLAGLAVLREIWNIREQIAQHLDRAPFMVVNNFTLVEIARLAPQSLAGLGAIKGVNEIFLARYGKQFLEGIKRGLELGPKSVSLPPRKPRDQNFLSSWEGQLAGILKDLRNQVAGTLELPGSVIASGDALESLSRDRPQSLEEMISQGALRKWQVELLSEKFLPVLRQSPPNGPSRRRRRRRKPA